MGINHRGKRYFVGQSYASHHSLAGFLFSDLMADVCKGTLGEEAYLHNDQYVIKCGQTGMSFAWHQDSAYVQVGFVAASLCFSLSLSPLSPPPLIFALLASSPFRKSTRAPSSLTSLSLMVPQARVGDHPECITVWCALDDCSEENGTIYILPAGATGTCVCV
jgi:hypothetical protein